MIAEWIAKALVWWSSWWVKHFGWLNPHRPLAENEVLGFPLGGETTVRYPGLTRTQAEQFEMVYDKLLEIRQQVDDALADMDALAESFAGNDERPTIRSA